MRRALLYSAFFNRPQPEGFTYLRALVIPVGTHVYLPINADDKITVNGSYVTASNTRFVPNGPTGMTGVYYVAKVLDNNTLDVDLFLPCISNEEGHVGEAALYSESRNKFYYGEENQLIAGDPYTKLENITFNNNVRYNRGSGLYNVHDVNIYEKVSIPIEIQSTTMLYEALTYSNRSLESIYLQRASNENKYVISTAISDNSYSSSELHSLSIDSEFVIDRINGVLKYNGNIGWYLPTSSYNPVVYTYQFDFIAGCTYENIRCINSIQNNNTLFMYLVPARINGKVGMYDVCNDTFKPDE